MIKIKLSINIISSFNDTNFINLLKNQNQVECEINNTEYNQVFQTLANNKANIWKKKQLLFSERGHHFCENTKGVHQEVDN